MALHRDRKPEPCLARPQSCPWPFCPAARLPELVPWVFLEAPVHTPASGRALAPPSAWRAPAPGMEVTPPAPRGSQEGLWSLVSGAASAVCCPVTWGVADPLAQGVHGPGVGVVSFAQGARSS